MFILQEKHGNHTTKPCYFFDVQIYNKARQRHEMQIWSIQIKYVNKPEIK